MSSLYNIDLYKEETYKSAFAYIDYDLLTYEDQAALSGMDEDEAIESYFGTEECFEKEKREIDEERRRRRAAKKAGATEE